MRIVRAPDDIELDETDTEDTETETETDAGSPGHTDAHLTINSDEYPPAFGFTPIPAPWDDEE